MTKRLVYICDWLPPDFGAVGQYAVLSARDWAKITASNQGLRAQYDSFMKLQLTGVDAVFQQKVREILGSDYPFDAPMVTQRGTRMPRRLNPESSVPSLDPMSTTSWSGFSVRSETAS